MSDAIRVAKVSELPSGSRKVFTAGGRSVVVFNVEGEFYAVDNQCPHRGAQLAEGVLDELVIQCPWHGWRFDLSTGECLSRPGQKVLCHEVLLENGDLALRFNPAEEGDSKELWAFEYLVRYGAMASIARFGSSEPVGGARGNRVVVRTDRGLEVGEVLVGPTDDVQPGASGEVVRLLSEEDQSQLENLRHQLEPLFEACQNHFLQRGLPVEAIDFDPLLDGDKVIIYFLGEPSAELGRLATELGGRYQASVEFQPAIEVAPAGCKSGGHCDCANT